MKTIFCSTLLFTDFFPKKLSGRKIGIEEKEGKREEKEKEREKEDDTLFLFPFRVTIQT